MNKAVLISVLISIVVALSVVAADKPKKKPRHFWEPPPPTSQEDIRTGRDGCLSITDIKSYIWWSGKQPHLSGAIHNDCAQLVSVSGHVLFIFHNQNGQDVQTDSELLIEEVGPGVTADFDIQPNQGEPIISHRAVLNGVSVYAR